VTGAGKHLSDFFLRGDYNGETVSIYGKGGFNRKTYPFGLLIEFLCFIQSPFEDNSLLGRAIGPAFLFLIGERPAQSIEYLIDKAVNIFRPGKSTTTVGIPAFSSLAR
jgi:hypothetical protein